MNRAEQIKYNENLIESLKYENKRLQFEIDNKARLIKIKAAKADAERYYQEVEKQKGFKVSFSKHNQSRVALLIRNTLLQYLIGRGLSNADIAEVIGHDTARVRNMRQAYLKQLKKPDYKVKIAEYYKLF